MIQVMVGRKGNIIITDRYVKDMVGTKKHIVIINLGVDKIEYIKKAVPRDVAENLEIVGESERVVFAKIRDFVVDVDVSTEYAETKYLHLMVEKRLKRTLFGRVSTDVSYRIVEVKTDAYTEMLGSKIADELSRIGNVTARRLRFFAMGYRLHEIPVAAGLKDEAVAEIRRYGGDSEKYAVKYERVDYLDWWFNSEMEISEEAKKVLEVLEFGREYEGVSSLAFSFSCCGVSLEIGSYWYDCEAIECAGVEVKYEDQYGRLRARFNAYGLIDAFIEGEEMRRRLLEDDEYLLEVAEMIESSVLDKRWVSDPYSVERDVIVKELEEELRNAEKLKPGEYEHAGVKLETARCYKTWVTRPRLWFSYDDEDEWEETIVCEADEEEARRVAEVLRDKLKVLRALFP